MKKLILLFFIFYFLFNCEKEKKVLPKAKLIRKNISQEVLVKDEILLGAIFAQTGSAAVYNKKSIEGVQIAVDMINQEGGILGKKIRVNYYDNISKAAGSKIAAKKAVKDNVIAIIGSAYSSHSLAAAPIAQKAKIPMISNVSTNPKVTLIGDYIFRVCYIDTFQGEIMAKFAYEELKARSAALVTMDNSYSDYSKDLADFFKTTFFKLGGFVNIRVSYSEQAKDFSEQLKIIKANQPDVIFVAGYSNEASFICKQARKMGIRSIFLGGDGWSGEKMIEVADESVENSYFASHWHVGIPGENNKKFVELTQNKLGENYQPNSNNALAYDALYVLKQAIEKAQSLDRIKIRKAISQITDFQGVTGIINFDKDGNPIKPVVILKIENGETHFHKLYSL